MADVTYGTPDYHRARDTILEAVHNRVAETKTDETALGLPLRDEDEPPYPAHTRKPWLIPENYGEAVTSCLDEVRKRIDDWGIDERKLRRRYSPMRHRRFLELTNRVNDDTFSLMMAFLIVNALGEKVNVSVTWPRRAP